MLLQGMQDLPGSGIEPVSAALASGLFTMEPPGKPLIVDNIKNYVQDFFILDYKYLNEMEGSEKNSSLYPLPASSTQ